jgi:CBS domain-containing protein
MVVCEGSEVSGIVTLGDIQRVPVAERATTPVGQVMTQRPELAVVGPRATLWEALQQLGDKDVEQAPVVEDGRFLGLLTRADIIRQLQLRELLGRGQPE